MGLLENLLVCGEFARLPVQGQIPSLRTLMMYSFYAVQCVGAMVAMNKALQELLTAEGCEPYVRDFRRYAKPGEKLCFYEIMLRASVRGEIAIGYKPMGGPGGGTLLKDDKVGQANINPSHPRDKRIWGEGDLVVIFSDE